MKKNALLFPKIELSEYEKLWLAKVYELMRSNQTPNYKSVRLELYKKLPRDFHPRNINPLVASRYGQEITLYGIHLIEPENDIIEKANRIIRHIRDTIIEKKVNEFKVDEIANEINFSVTDVGMVLHLIERYGRFYTSSGGRYGDFAYAHFGIGDDEDAFDEYIYFTSFEDLIKKHFEKLENEKSTRYEYYDPIVERHIPKPSHSIFRSIVEQIDTSLAFALMPFGPKWSKRIYESYIKKNIEGLGLQCIRADALNGRIIIEDIWTKINQAAFIIADVTDKNPNVMYELGIAHALDKPVILVTQDVTNIPFDFRHHRHYEYQDNIEGLEPFAINIESAIKAIYLERYPNYQFKS